MINATTNDPTAKNQTSNDPAKVGVGSVVADKSTQAPAEAPTSKAPIFNMPTTPPSPVTPTPVEFNKGMVGGNLKKPVAEKPELKNTGIMGAPTNSNTPPGSDEKTTKPKKKKKFNVKMIAGVFALLLLIVGASAGLFLSQQPQDIRQQAYSNLSLTRPCGNDSACGSAGCNLTTYHCNPTQPGETDNPLVILSDEMIESGTTLFQTVNPDGTYTGNIVTADEFNDHNNQVSGFYWYPPGNPNGKRYVIGVPSTMAAVTQASTNNTELWESLNIGDPSDGSAIDLRPRLICDSAGNYNVGVCSGNTITTVDQYGNTITLSGTIIDGVFYLNDEGYNQLVDLGQTWVSNATGCNDGVNDGTTTSPTNTNFAGDCNAWHWTTCLNQGSGVGGYGCDVDPPDNPPGEETPPPTTAPPTTPPSLTCNSVCTTDTQCSDLNSEWFCAINNLGQQQGNCRLQTNPASTTCEPSIPGEPMCKDVAVLEDGVEINPATAPLSIGTVLQFRCAADYTPGTNPLADDNPITHYEFRVTEPDGTIIEGNAINPAGSSATSLEYQINQYLEHQVQCRVCQVTGCQEYIDVVQMDQ